MDSFCGWPCFSQFYLRVRLPAAASAAWLKMTLTHETKPGNKGVHPSAASALAEVGSWQGLRTVASGSKFKMCIWHVAGTSPHGSWNEASIGRKSKTPYQLRGRGAGAGRGSGARGRGAGAGRGGGAARRLAVNSERPSLRGRNGAANNMNSLFVQSSQKQ